AVHPDGSRLYVATNACRGASCLPGSLFVVDTATNRVTATVPVGRGSLAVAVHPLGTRVYVENYTDETVSVIDTTTNTLLGQLSVDSRPGTFGAIVGPVCPDIPDVCSDDNPCTSDVCNPLSGCQHAVLPDGSSCSDGNACNGAEICHAGICTRGTAPDCEDGNPCTVDTCSAAAGCIHTPILSCSVTTTTSTIPRPATTTVPCGTARCTLDTALQSPECAGQAVPRNITTKLDQATQLIE